MSKVFKIILKSNENKTLNSNLKLNKCRNWWQKTEHTPGIISHEKWAADSFSDMFLKYMYNEKNI